MSTETSISAEAQKTGSTDSVFLGLHLNGINLLLVLIYGVLITILGIIFIKRLILRVRISSKFFHLLNSPGAGAPKKLKNEINKALEKSMNLMYEPKLLTADDQRVPGTTNHLCDVHRMKTVDYFSELDKALSDLNKDLARPPGKNIRQHLHDVKSHSSGCMSSIRTNKLQNIADLYMRARYGSEQYTCQDHERFVGLATDVVSVLRRRTHGHQKRPKSKKREMRRQNATSVSDDEQSHQNILLESGASKNEDDVVIVTKHETTSFSDPYTESTETPIPSSHTFLVSGQTDVDPLL